MKVSIKKSRADNLLVIETKSCYRNYANFKGKIKNQSNFVLRQFSLISFKYLIKNSNYDLITVNLGVLG